MTAPKEQKKQTINRLTTETCASYHKIHGEHPELGAKELPYLKNKLEKLQNQIKELESKYLKQDLNNCHYNTTSFLLMRE